jgi:hypothetical protein
MKRILWILAIVVAVAAGLGQNSGRLPLFNGRDAAPAAATDAIDKAYRDRQSALQVMGQGEVTALLSDDKQGSRHQRFILRLASGLTVLVAHNIDLAPRIDGLQKGDTVAFNGVYEWNDKGGVVHWTHHDPAGRHVPGWLRHAGRTYE